MTTDVHQHLWPEALLEALAARSRAPAVRRAVHLAVARVRVGVGQLLDRHELGAAPRHLEDAGDRLVGDDDPGGLLLLHEGSLCCADEDARQATYRHAAADATLAR